MYVFCSIPVLFSGTTVFHHRKQLVSVVPVILAFFDELHAAASATIKDAPACLLVTIY